MMNTMIISALQNSTETYTKEINMFDEAPMTVAFIFLQILIPIVVAIALIYLYVLLVKYLKLKIKEMKNRHTDI